MQHRRFTMSRAQLRAAASLGACAFALTAAGALAQTADTPKPADPTGIEDIVVTAQRREENVSRVPISIATYSQAQMDRQGIRKIDDLSRLTPALNFTVTSGANANNGTNISIRGIASEVGSATTAIYIDDTPIQIRNIGYLGGNPYPRVFDLDRVEVLRGPQGTLFGASAEGGAVRFITAQPSFTDTQVYARGELSHTEHGAESYEGGAAVGTPVSDTLAVRASGWFRRDGGYIDRVATGTNNVFDKDVNSQRTYATKFGLSWRPTEDLTITPGVYYQKIDTRTRDEYWQGYGNPSHSNYVTGAYNLDPGKDRFVIPSLKVEFTTGKVSVISNTAYFDRKLFQSYSYATYQAFLTTGNPLGTFINRDPGNSDANLSTGQKNFVQELRIQSVDNALIDWTVGGYYSKTKQHVFNLFESGQTPGVPSIIGGQAQYLGRYSFFEEIHADDRQLAGYANLDIKPLENLKLSVSARYTHNSFGFDDTTDGPIVGNFRTTVNSSSKENSFTPKFTATYQATPTNMVYATASKGFRPGGAQPIVDPFFCGADLALLGLTTSPTSYASDTLWNFEVGTKNRFMDNRLTIDGSVYRLKWKNIQQSVNLPFCNLNFVGNLGSATGKGAEVSIAATPVTGFQLGANIAYTRITYDDNQFIGANRLVADGQRFGGPRWTGSVFGQFDYPVSNTTTAYARADYSFVRGQVSRGIPGNFGFDPDLPALPGTDFLSLRAGARFNGVDLSLFVDNVTNSHDLLSRNHDGFGGTLFYAQSFRPRTIGLTAQFRY